MLEALSRLAAGLAFVAVLTGTASAEMIYDRGNTSEPESLDPHKVSTVNEANILRDLFEGLVMPDAKANLIPGAAGSWTLSDDGTVYTFKLREGAVWSNGDPVTADDFVYSFRRLEDPATGAEYASMLYVVKNAEEVNTGEAPPEEIGARAIDARTLEVTLDAPTPYFLEMLTHQATYPVNRASVETFGADAMKPGNLVSNGAFTLAEWVPNDHITLRKNPRFHDAANVMLDVVNYYPTEDVSVAMKRFQAGEIDSNNELPTERLDDIEATFGDQVHVIPSLGGYYYAIKNNKEPWGDAGLRRAVSIAIDRDFLARKAWGGAMFAGYGIVPPGIEGYAPYRADYADMDPIEREEEAADILAAHGYGPEHPLKLEIRFPNEDNNRATGVAIQEQLRPLGIEVSLFGTDAKTHWAHLENNGDFDLAVAGWGADYRDPETFLGIARKTSGNNLGRYDNPQFDRLLDSAAVAAADPTRRMQLLAQAEKVLVDDVGLLPLLFYSSHNIVSSRVKGWEENALDFHPSRFISVEE